ncbi:SCO family protein [Dokdonella sp.]|uniref:SCO family protein n=1 Tax=Dokdonella sp. TaxID=2291710 RepID=UPI0025BE6BC4|nr:SCO family protein [Dokdonella sp.]MBX3692961.1 SCO family protein [Dokdonella sp.]MCW5568210.1 SCO family protein [Dokdonella sp.]
MTAPPTRTRIGATPLILIAAVAVAIGFFVGSRFLGAPPAPAMTTAVLYPAPREVPAFNLAAADGKPLTAADWKGRWTLVFIGFTHCPDVCPNTLAVFRQVWNRLDAQGLTARLRFAFISVDPERDNGTRLTDYVRYFHPDFEAATGSNDDLTRFTRSLGLVYTHVPDDKGGYSVDHSASVVIIDPDGRVIGLFRPPLEVEPIATDLATLAGKH